jgi:hypothetical protein
MGAAAAAEGCHGRARQPMAQVCRCTGQLGACSPVIPSPHAPVRGLTVGVGPAVGHGDGALLVLEGLQVLVRELPALAVPHSERAGAVAVDDVAALHHEVLDDAVELGALVGHAAGGLAQGNHGKVLDSAGGHVAVTRGEAASFMRGLVAVQQSIGAENPRLHVAAAAGAWWRRRPAVQALRRLRGPLACGACRGKSR